MADARRMDVHVDVLEGAEPHVFVLAAHEQVIRHADVHAEAGGIAVGRRSCIFVEFAPEHGRVRGRSESRPDQSGSLGLAIWSDEGVSLRSFAHIFFEARLKPFKRQCTLIQRHVKRRALASDLQCIRYPQPCIK